MERKFFVVLNPYSGKGKSQVIWKLLKKRLDDLGFYHALFLTPQSENLHEFIEENLFTDTTDVVVIGGDGTINATLQVIYDKEVVLHVLPAGTGNDFAKTVDIGHGPHEQIETIINGKVRLIDIGDCNGRKFINGVGVGFDGQVVFDNANKKSLLTGHAKYYSHVLRILGSYRSRPVTIELDDQKIMGRFLIVAIHNGTTFGGGFKLNPSSRIDDGYLNICAISRMPAWKRFLNIPKLSFGKHGTLREVKFYQAERIKIHRCQKSFKAHMDGEYFGEPPFEIRVIPSALRVRVRNEQPF